MEGSMFEFLMRENGRCVTMLEQNDDVMKFIRGTVEHLVQFANHKGVPFKDVYLETPHIADFGGDQVLRAIIRTR